MPLLYLGAGFQPAEHLLPVAEAAEEHGFDGLALPDHVASPVRIDSSYPDTDTGDVPWELDKTPWPDPWIGLTAVAARTERLRLMTHIFVLPMRHPIFVAKTLGTVAALFPGRAELGIGVGWMSEEFALLHSEFRNRGSRTEECIGVLRALWGPQPASYHGKHYSFNDIAMFPVPETPPPIYIGGHSEPAHDRATRIGDGVVTMPMTMEELSEGLIPDIRRRLKAHGRDGEPFHINVLATDAESPDDFKRLDDLGVTSMQVHPFTREEALHAPLQVKIDAIRRYADRIISALTR